MRSVCCLCAQIKITPERSYGAFQRIFFWSRPSLVEALASSLESIYSVIKQRGRSLRSPFPCCFWFMESYFYIYTYKKVTVILTGQSVGRELAPAAKTNIQPQYRFDGTAVNYSINWNLSNWLTRILCSYISPIHQITARAVRVTSVSMVTP